jgi:hypothetical protein
MRLAQGVRQDHRERTIPANYAVRRWRFVGLAQWIFEEFRITFAK